MNTKLIGQKINWVKTPLWASIIAGLAWIIIPTMEMDPYLKQRWSLQIGVMIILSIPALLVVSYMNRDMIVRNEPGHAFNPMEYFRVAALAFVFIGADFFSAKVTGNGISPDSVICKAVSSIFFVPTLTPALVAMIRIVVSGKLKHKVVAVIIGLFMALFLFAVVYDNCVYRDWSFFKLP